MGNKLQKEKAPEPVEEDPNFPWPLVSQGNPIRVLVLGNEKTGQSHLCWGVLKGWEFMVDYIPKFPKMQVFADKVCKDLWMCDSSQLGEENIRKILDEPGKNWDLGGMSKDLSVSGEDEEEGGQKALSRAAYESNRWLPDDSAEFFLHVDVVVLCFSLTDPKSFYDVSNKWLPLLKKNKPFCDAPVILVGTKRDLRDKLLQRELNSFKWESQKDFAEPESVSHIASLPEPVLLQIFSLSSVLTVCRLTRVCKKWRDIIRGAGGVFTWAQGSFIYTQQGEKLAAQIRARRYFEICALILPEPDVSMVRIQKALGKMEFPIVETHRRWLFNTSVSDVRLNGVLLDHKQGRNEVTIFNDAILLARNEELCWPARRLTAFAWYKLAQVQKMDISEPDNTLHLTVKNDRGEDTRVEITMAHYVQECHVHLKAAMEGLSNEHPPNERYREIQKSVQAKTSQFVQVTRTPDIDEVWTFAIGVARFGTGVQFLKQD